MSEFLKIIEIDGVEHLVIEHTEKQEIEFRVYFDDDGKILFYTCEKPEGNYITIDKDTFAAARPDLRVVNGKLVALIPGVTITKYKTSDTDGINCASEDICIVVDEKHKNKQKWKLTSYELR